MKQMEEYRAINGYNNYEVSNLGNIRNITTSRILKPSINTGGYLQVSLYQQRNKTSTDIHRLVAEAFIENQENKRCVDHINRNILDNNVTNLRWATISQNSMNKSKHSNNTSTVTGVCFDNRSQKWQVRIKVNRKQMHGGMFDNFEEAIAKRKELEEIYFKEFKRID